MTSLPSIPSNLNPADSVGNLSKLTNKLPTFPDLPQLPTASQANIPSELDADSLISSVIPQKEIDSLIEKYRLPDGTVQLDKVQEEINQKYNTAVEGYEKIINATQVKPASVTGILTKLLPKLPIPVIPNPAKIKQYIDNLIENTKRSQQQATAKAQELAAKAEETPFTARENQTKQQQVKPSCIQTGVGNTVEEAVASAETKLKQGYQCVGNTRVLEVIEFGRKFTVKVIIE